MRLTRIDTLDLNRFEFDYDLTFMVFFLNADGEIYARYGARDARGPDERQSLGGLRYTMQSVLKMHARPDKVFAPRVKEPPKTVRQIAPWRRGCFHCHQVKEILSRELKRAGKWSRDLVWRYPPPDNLGLLLEVDRGNVVERVEPDTPAARAGLRRGDLLERLGGVPLHSQADVFFALDRAPPRGKVPLSWRRDGKARDGTLTLPEGWRKSDLTWRPSMINLLASLHLYGPDLTATEKRALGLSTKQLAFRQRDPVHSSAKAAGVRAGDVILGIDGGEFPGMDAAAFREFVRREHLAGDRVRVDLLRAGKRLSLPLTLP